jgi:hypothetical protein
LTILIQLFRIPLHTRTTDNTIDTGNLQYDRMRRSALICPWKIFPFPFHKKDIF